MKEEKQRRGGERKGEFAMEIPVPLIEATDRGLVGGPIWDSLLRRRNSLFGVSTMTILTCPSASTYLHMHCAHTLSTIDVERLATLDHTDVNLDIETP